MLDWSKFEKLSGDKRINFENLCRSVIHIKFSKYGKFKALSNQAGVEFHLELTEDCQLGKRGECIGWQCKWYDIAKTQTIGKKRKSTIKDGIKKTEKYFPQITKWILWTKHNLTKADHEWFDALNTKLTLQAEDERYLEMLLSGEAFVLKETYFGELIMSKDWLKSTHKVTAAKVGMRWVTDVHQISNAENLIRKRLCEPSSWNVFLEVIESIEATRRKIVIDKTQIHPTLITFVDAWDTEVDYFTQEFNTLNNHLIEGDFERIKHTISNLKPRTATLAATPRKLRAAKLYSGLLATNICALIEDAHRHIKEIEKSISTRIIAIIADAGGGKTQLSAEVTSPTDQRSAGILLYGRDLVAGSNLNALSRNITLNTKSIANLEALLSALNSEGQRQSRRLPIFIDGLNEADRPSDWKPCLSELDELLKAYPFVMTVCTVRSGVKKQPDTWNMGSNFLDPQHEDSNRDDFAVLSLPERIFEERVEMEAFDVDPVESVRQYFDYYKIDSGRLELPLNLLQHPLSLRIFCEVTNPKRDKIVKIKSIPLSLCSLFEEYISRTATRISEISANSISEDEVHNAIYQLATHLWKKQTREMPMKKLRKLVNDTQRLWADSIIPLMEQEGLLLINPGNNRHEKVVVPAYDALGGFFIAYSVLEDQSRPEVCKWLKNEKNSKKLLGDDAHPLANDILAMLVNLVPMKYSGLQMWKVCSKKLRNRALISCLDISPDFIDEETLDEVHKLFSSKVANPRYIFAKLYEQRASVEHPFNSNFLDRILRSLAVAERDLIWTEWIRTNYPKKYSTNIEVDIKEEVEELIDDWKSRDSRDDIDRLLAKRLLWFLSTTIQKLRDKVTYALYCYGLSDSKSLFDLTQGSLEINDPTIPERMLAASAGVMMANAGNNTIDDHCISFAKTLHSLITDSTKKVHTTNVISVEYIKVILSSCNQGIKPIFSETDLQFLNTLNEDFESIPICWTGDDITTEGSKAFEADNPFSHHFENSMMRRLVTRSVIYDSSNKEDIHVREQLRWRIKELGWTAVKFKDIDRRITSHDPYSPEPLKIDKYSDKYSTIAYNELLGWRHRMGLKECDHGEERTSEVDIDPSFPQKAIVSLHVSDDFLWKKEKSLKEWINIGPVPNLEKYLVVRDLQQEKGEWLLLDGYINQQDENRGRRIFSYTRSFIVKTSERKEIEDLFKKREVSEYTLRDKPSSHYFFSGELPWGITDHYDGDRKLSFKTGSEEFQTEEDEPLIYLDGKEVSIDEILGDDKRLYTEDHLNKKIEEYGDRFQLKNKKVTKINIRDIYKHFKVNTPVFDLAWEGRSLDSSNGSAVSLNKKIATELNLRNIPNSFDLQTDNQERVTFNIKHGSGFDNSQQFFYCRKDVLDKYLNANNLSLILVQWGEREVSHRMFDRTKIREELDNVLHKEFIVVLGIEN